MDRVARNHDVGKQTANQNIITRGRLDHAILLLPKSLTFRQCLAACQCLFLPVLSRCPNFFSHIGGTTVVEEGRTLVDAARMVG